MSKGKLKLNDRQERFCLEYVKDLNATQAAIRAGYSEKTAKSIGAENLTKPDLQKRISELQNDRNNELKVDAQYVLNRLLEIDQMDVLDILSDDGSIKAIHNWPKVWRTSLSGIDLAEMFEGRGDERDLVGILKKIKWPDKVKNLELLGKHIGINAFSERQDIKMSLNPLSDLIDEIGNEARNNSRESKE